MARGFPIYHQLDARDCGPACLRMVAAWYGKVFPLASLRELTAVDREGTSLENLASAAERIGLESMAVRLPLQGTPGLVDAPFPCILHWEDRHFVVLYRISKGKFYIADPAKGKYRLRKQAFLEKWTGNESEGVALLVETTPFFRNQTPPSEQTVGWRFLWPYLRPYKALIRQLFIGLAVVTGIQVVLPFVTKAVVDLGIGNRDIGLIWLLLMGQLFLVAGQTAATFFQNWIFLHLGTRFNIRLLNDFLRKLMGLPLRFFDQRLTGDLLNRIHDHRRIELFVTQAGLSLILSVAQLLIFGILLFFFHPLIFGIFALATVLYFSWFLLFWRKRAIVDADRFEQLSEHQHALVELIQGMPEIKLQGSGRKRRQSWAAIQAALFKVNMRGLRISNWQDGGTSLITQTKDVVILLIAALAVVEGRLSLGSLLAIQFIIGQLNTPLRQIAGFLRQAQDARISLHRFGEINNLEPEEEVGSEGAWKPLDGDLRLDRVSFSYGITDEPVLNDMQLHIPKGKVSAIVGASGSGKTTLLKLLLGFYQPDSGRLLLGDVPMNALSKTWWRQQCGAVLQDGFIFSDTLANNITESSEHIDKAQLQKAVQVACLEEMVSQLPKGFDTVIGARGNSLSQGQRQRVLIARAIYKDPPFLIFDEATNALDTRTERQIMENLANYYRGRTVIVVAHRLSTVQAADQIIVLNAGRVAELGTHSELVANAGVYYELIRNQLDLNP